jgi:hypothetical protein
MDYKAPEARQFTERTLLSPFNYSGVRLKGGMFERQFNEMRVYFVAIPNDDILRGFRLRAGLPAAGEDLGGWYSADMPLSLMFPSRPSTLCHTFGQWLGALARMYRIDGDDRIREKATYLLDEWGKTIDSSGFFFYGSNPAIRHYDFDKTLGGLLDVYEYMEYRSALDYAETITEWAIRNLERRRIPATPDLHSGGGWVGNDSADVEWYTLPENLYRLYLVTGREKHLAFARLWHYESYWKKLAEGSATAMQGLHAYSHVNTLSSAAMAYGVSGDEKYLRSVGNAYHLLLKHQLFATGGYGPGERFGADKSGLRDSLALQRDSFETPCGTWAAFKMARYLQMFTAGAAYGDWTERLLYNGIGAALPMAARGKTFYYADYCLSGGEKTYFVDRRFQAGPEPGYTPWPCCSGTYPLAVADYHNIIFYSDSKSLYINLFVPSEVGFQIDGFRVFVRLDTDYPNSGRIVLGVETPRALMFGIKFRVPTWVDDPVAVAVNGVEVPIETEPGSWAAIERLWMNGDSVIIHIPMRLRLESLADDGSDPVALMYGPAILATGDEGSIERNGISSSICRTRNDALVFEVPGRKVFRPFYDFKEGELYYLFLRTRPDSGKKA